MALKEYLGAIILEIDGQEYEIVDFNEQHETGRKVVKTMNGTGRAKGYHQGVKTWELSITAVVPKDDALDWSGVEGAKLTIYPVTEGGKRESYQDCAVVSIGNKYTVDSEARVDVKLLSLNKVEE
ncbi:Transaldolase [Desulfovibrio sp. DV]|uniref:phage tail protein n=1 Tax=Desulfovibrio sp. DV TaxID=1844708 RepID=UPI00094B9C00|nr:phage tail protein [Desulfovibrio sp. DV]OLN30446.1 Transaldolase [Desulfovibrio sp. DV]